VCAVAGEFKEDASFLLGFFLKRCRECVAETKKCCTLLCTRMFQCLCRRASVDVFFSVRKVSTETWGLPTELCPELFVLGGQSGGTLNDNH
jgi:hypothetical protein